MPDAPRDDTPRGEFLAGERPEDVAIYLSAAAVDDVETLAQCGEAVDGGAVLVVEGDRGRQAFQAAAGVDPMAFAREAMDAEGTVDPGLTGGACPDESEDQDADHAVRFVFAFAEEQNEAVGGDYAEGDVIHAYAQCACGTAYSDRWIAGERTE